MAGTDPRGVNKPKRMVVSQSRTMWVAKGDIVNGKVVQKGYLAQLGKPEKKVSARVLIETPTKSGKKAGETYRYKAGRVVKPAAKPKAPAKPKPPTVIAEKEASAATMRRVRTGQITKSTKGKGLLKEKSKYRSPALNMSYGGGTPAPKPKPKPKPKPTRRSSTSGGWFESYD